MDAMIKLDNVMKRIGPQEILKGISLEVEAGTTQVIVGPSGTGKSVTLKHIVGLMRPDSGSVRVAGTEMATASGKELAEVRRKFGLLFQSGALIAWMSVFENVALPLREHTRMSEKEIADAVLEKLAMVGMEGSGPKKPAELSGGMRKRVGLARAIVHTPQIVLYDEPTSGLDPSLSREVDQLINRLKQDLKITSVVVTHDVRSACDVGDRIAMLYRGEIVENAPPEAFLTSQHPIVRKFVEDAKLTT